MPRPAAFEHAALPLGGLLVWHSVARLRFTWEISRTGPSTPPSFLKEVEFFENVFKGAVFGAMLRLRKNGKGTPHLRQSITIKERPPNVLAEFG